jgi:hypothetical protein
MSILNLDLETKISEGGFKMVQPFKYGSGQAQKGKAKLEATGKKLGPQRVVGLEGVLLIFIPISLFSWVVLP